MIKTVALLKQHKEQLAGLTLKHLVTLKLYTDFDKLRNELKKCYLKSKNYDERQKEFYQVNKLLISACDSSRHTVTTKLYIGSNKQFNIMELLPINSFNCKWYGPLSTTKFYDISKKFAGINGKILQVIPDISWRKKGLPISWLSKYPDQQEILFMSGLFNIVNINIIKPFVDLQIILALNNNH